MPPAEPAPGVVGEVPQNRIDRAVPEDRERHGDPRPGMGEPESVRIIEHGEAEEGIHQ